MHWWQISPRWALNINFRFEVVWYCLHAAWLLQSSMTCFSFGPPLADPPALQFNVRKKHHLSIGVYSVLWNHDNQREKVHFPILSSSFMHHQLSCPFLRSSGTYLIIYECPFFHLAQLPLDRIKIPRFFIFQMAFWKDTFNYNVSDKATECPS